MHVKTYILYIIGDVRTYKRQVLKGASNASARFEVRHTCTGNDVLCVLALGQEEPACYALDRDTEKEV